MKTMKTRVAPGEKKSTPRKRSLAAAARGASVRTFAMKGAKSKGVPDRLRQKRI